MVSRKNRPTELVDMGKLMSGAGVDPLLLCQIEGPGPPRKVRVLPLEEAVIGRDDDCEILLDEGPVSRTHAKVDYQDYQPELYDLGSTNGTVPTTRRRRCAEFFWATTASDCDERPTRMILPITRLSAPHHC